MIDMPKCALSFSGFLVVLPSTKYAHVARLSPHGITCASIETFLLRGFSPHELRLPAAAADYGQTILDIAIGHIPFSDTPRCHRQVKAVVKAIERIRVRCANQSKLHDILTDTAAQERRAIVDAVKEKARSR
ncbi:hypothetical protein HDV05_000795 [Chytridiales sp. JEL 0842]|nr:hypothetical protein HDV05_000795 [Chytridiales sp. JEL 0842]